jgi:hypothetical protein
MPADATASTGRCGHYAVLCALAHRLQILHASTIGCNVLKICETELIAMIASKSAARKPIGEFLDSGESNFECTCD